MLARFPSADIRDIVQASASLSSRIQASVSDHSWYFPFAKIYIYHSLLYLIVCPPYKTIHTREMFRLSHFFLWISRSKTPSITALLNPSDVSPLSPGRQRSPSLSNSGRSCPLGGMLTGRTGKNLLDATAVPRTRYQVHN